jgi:hypothetical protein
MNRKTRLFLAVLVLVAAPRCHGTVTQPTPPKQGHQDTAAAAPARSQIWYRDPFPSDGGGGTTCAKQCSDGSWSSIACLSNETAHCTCTGSPLLANPYCTRNP